jgi:UDP-N-acetylmuramate dehydrogenase
MGVGVLFKGMIYLRIDEKLINIVGEHHVVCDKPLKNHTYTRLGGTADYFVTPVNYLQVQEIVKLAKEENIDFTLLGNGSNLIIKDGGIRGIVMYLGELSNIRVSGSNMIAQSGALIAQVSKEALGSKLSGLEFACGIPGSVGGALFMNAGAYGGEIKDVLLHATVIDCNGDLRTIKAEELDLAYRKSNIPEKGYIVLEAEFGLLPGEFSEIQAIMDDLTYKRESKQPLEYPTCGSVFKRPPGYFAGKLIQDSGLQGKQIGGAQVSLKHAGFIINKDEATANEYIGLIEYVQQVVQEKFGVTLEREVRIIGEDAVENG